VPLVDKKWTQLPKDLNEQIWEAVQMAYVVGEGGKKMVLSSTAKKWKDFKYTLTRQFILPFANKKEKLKEPPQLYNFIEKSQWDAFVASSLSQDFEAMHSEQSQRREKCEYNHRLTRKGMLVWRINWKKPCPVKKSIDLCYGRRQEDKQGNIPDPKVAEKAKLIDDLKKQVSEGTLTVCVSNDVLTLALGTPEHGGKVRDVGARVSPTQFFNLPRQQRVKFADKLEESVMEAVREETKKMEARAKQSVLEAVRAEREILLKQFSQLIPNLL
ncbi:PREDICTED: transposon CACTA, partial [Prunus dulcis]